MAARTTPEKRPRFFTQIKTLFTFTSDVFAWVPWVIPAILVVGAGLGVLAGFLISPFAVWSVILWGITGLMVGILAAMILLTRLATRAMYRKIDGMPGATGHVISTGLGRRWQGSDMPVAVNPKTQEAVYRVVGRGGIVIIGEGSRARLTRLINDERMKAQRVASGVPLHVLYVGHGDDDVPISKLTKTIKGYKTSITRPTMAAVVQRMGSISPGMSSLPIPKGIDPTKVRAPRPR